MVMPDGVILSGPIPPPSQAATRESGERPIFLLIDDDTMVGRFIGHAAEECGYQAIRTSNFDSFVDNFRRTAPVSVAVDLCIPGCDGVDIIREGRDGLIADLSVMVRPLSGLTALAEEMGRRLGAAPA